MRELRRLWIAALVMKVAQVHNRTEICDATLTQRESENNWHTAETNTLVPMPEFSMLTNQACA